MLIFGGAFTWRGLFSKFYGIFPKTRVKIKCDFLGALVLVMYKIQIQKNICYWLYTEGLNYNKLQ